MREGFPYSRLTDDVVASTTTITIKSDIVRLTGTTAVATINPLTDDISTVIFVIPVDGSVATTTAGNILKAVTMIQNQVCVLVRSRITGKWYPGAIS